MNKGNLEILVGISASGKSTYAHEKWLSDPNKYIIVSRDKIRELLFGFNEGNMEQYYSMNNISGFEKQITRYEDTIINDALSASKTVIIDATNLNRSYIERFKYWNVPAEVLIFEVELDEAIDRDSSRTRVVGENLIRKQYDRFIALIKDLAKNPVDFEPLSLVQNVDNEPCVIFDIDGTLAIMDKNLRSPYDWDKVGLDTVDVPTKYMLDAVNTSTLGCKVIICTGRDGVCIDETEQWLGLSGIEYDEIYIRDQGDQRPDWVVKEEMWRKISEDNYILGMFDDRQQVVRRARVLGLKVFNVEYNNF